VTGNELLPVTREVVTQWRAQERARKDAELLKTREAARRTPKPVNPEQYVPFDPKTGEPRVWYFRSDDGEYHFYDAPGFDPHSGGALIIISKDVLQSWQETSRTRSSQKCYVITRDPSQPVQYRDQAGIDPVTGRECRPVTPEALERLREYETGKRPQRITDGDNAVFFDPRTGESILWFARRTRGAIELFDLMGFHPETGEELLPVTKEVAALWKDQSRRRPPKRVDPQTYELFDALSGEPRVWYWRESEGVYEFFDNPGFHPRSGDPLIALTREAVSKIFKEIESREQKAAEEKRKREEEARRLAEAREKQQREREDEKNRQSAAAKLCDQLAANPTDAQRKSDGVPFESLRSHVDRAIESCELAAKKSSEILRFRYQLARSLQVVDRERAFQLLRELVQKQYAAAFDNIGWLYLSLRKNIPEAVQHFRAGVRLGNADAMVSLAEMYQRGYAQPRNSAESKSVLLEAAANLGHAGAIKELEQEEQKSAETEQRRALEQEQARRMMEFFGGVIQSMPRR